MTKKSWKDVDHTNCEPTELDFFDDVVNQVDQLQKQTDWTKHYIRDIYIHLSATDNKHTVSLSESPSNYFSYTGDSLFDRKSDPTTVAEELIESLLLNYCLAKGI